MKKKLAIGILAHVDAGKTTLCEGLLYLTGSIRKKGRVDHGDAYLDTHMLEKKRGITIFSKQANFKTDTISVTLLDTPGHVDFSTEAERILSVLDYAILVISGSEGVQAHTETLWKLLRRYGIPTFIFVNKMDLSGADETNIMTSLHKRISEGCINFSSAETKEKFENIALSDEDLFDSFIDKGKLSDTDIAGAIKKCKVFPCFFGAALHLRGIEEFILGLDRFTLSRTYSDEFGARVFKITRDPQGARLTHIKIMGGSLAVRTEIEYSSRSGDSLNEKISQIRLYSGTKFEQTDKVSAGDICTVTGLSATFPGQGLGFEKAAPSPILEPVLNYRISLPAGSDPRTFLPKLMQLSEEDPQLHIVWNEHLREIHAQLMGEIQIEVLKSLVKERFDLDIEIDCGKIMYRETILAPVEGIGHFEPLRHYAEVHLLLEPLSTGSGLIFASCCDQNLLDINWQRLILTHLYEKTHLGVLTGSPITDMKISLIAGRASLSHTEGGDFRQATYRAVRQGLMKAKSVLLEPYYEFAIEVPMQQLGRAINDIRMMGGSFSNPTDDGEMATFTGTAPVSAMREYASELAAYTKGRGRLSCAVSHYAKCQNEQQVIEEYGYDPERDLENTPDSVFCAHGAGFPVKWNKVESYMHIDTNLNLGGGLRPSEIMPKVINRNLDIDERELEAIMLREFGPIKRPEYGVIRSSCDNSGSSNVKTEPNANRPSKKDYLIIDGYNIIFAWESLRELAKSDIAAARKQLMDIMSNYCGYKKGEVILVFDGYKVKGNTGERFNYHSIHVAYTKENETADMFIEKLIAQIGKNYAVRVASSDGMIQLSSVRTGVLRMTASELEAEVDGVNETLHQIMEKLKRTEKRK